MEFKVLAQYFEKLEGTSSRLSLIEILSELFKEIKTPDEIEKVCYLVQGRIAPFFEATEIGMADKTVAKAIATAYEIDGEKVLKHNAKLGDMGLVADQLHQESKHTNQHTKITIDEVFTILKEIAGTSGAGTIEKKLTLLSDLLKKIDHVSAKYLVRIPLGNLRLGIGDPTILDALATVKFGDKKNRKLLEGAYNRTSDLGLIARTLWQHQDPESSLKAVQKLDVTVGKPIRSELCERLPNAEKAIEKMEVVDVQYKYDGFRTQIHKNGDEISIYSRNLENMSHMFPELIEGARKQIKAKTAILDAEALAYNPESEEFLPFQETTKRRRKYNIEEVAKQLPLKAFAFDILYKNGKSLIDEPLTKRLEILAETIDGNEILIVTKTKKVDDAKVLAFMLEDAISKGLEGVVIKKLESPYEAGGRNFNWVKLKRHSSGELKDTIDCVILGYIYGRGKRTAFGAGALLVGVYDKKEDMFVTVSKIGTGLSDEEWQSIKKRTHGLELDHKPARVTSLVTPSVWVKPEIVIEVLADEITRSPIHTAGAVITQSDGKDVREPGYALRFPRLVSFRDTDKSAEDATTVKELIEMYSQQGKK
ncbi:MAG TPA: ATP-dependent DNA ligase [Candidatus Saccharimonadales bacterium]|nr:ATP-dependent DNA ligase [Candidatus Saccharimonadales bacterium]